MVQSCSIGHWSLVIARFSPFTPSCHATDAHKITGLGLTLTMDGVAVGMDCLSEIRERPPASLIVDVAVGLPSHWAPWMGYRHSVAITAFIHGNHI